MNSRSIGTSLACLCSGSCIREIPPLISLPGPPAGPVTSRLFTCFFHSPKGQLSDRYG